MSEPLSPGFLVWNPQGEAPRVPHSTFDKAKREALRLAASRPGHQFYVLAPIALAEVERPRPTLRSIDPAKVTPEVYDLDDEIPF